jgi:hypothetical protein
MTPEGWALSLVVPDGRYRDRLLGQVALNNDWAHLRYYARRRGGELGAAALLLLDMFEQPIGELALDAELGLRALAARAAR